MGREFYVTRDVKAGDELFLNYGHCKREASSDSADWSTMIPMVEDYRQAAQIIWDAGKANKNLDAEIPVPKNVNKYVAALIRQGPTDELRTIIASDKVSDQRELMPFVAKHLATTPRTPDWIRTNGMCLEHLTAGKSRLPQAGQGAFSQHTIRMGEMVVPAPMVQIVDKEVLNTYDAEGNLNGAQLLLNYCFGHPESSMLLCPDTNALLINHCSDRKKQCGPDGPNAIVRWSSGWEPASAEWLKMSIEEISEERVRGLSMEIIALRDIAPGEEVFLDYGTEWEDAWEKHVATWKPPVKEVESYITAKEANEKEGILELLVTGDLRKVSDHPYLFTGCEFHHRQLDIEKLDMWTKPEPGWVEWSDEEILKRFSHNGAMIKGNYTTHRDRAHWPCSVIREQENGLYTVRIHNRFGKRPPAWEKNDLPRLLTNFQRESIHYFVKPHTSDQNLPGVFRHPIGIHDELFPEQWKNRKQN